MCYPFPLGSLSFFLSRVRFGDTGAAKNRRDHGIPFVAHPLVHGSFCLRPGNLRSPGLRPRGGIFNRELVNQNYSRMVPVFCCPVAVTATVSRRVAAAVHILLFIIPPFS